MGLRKYKPTTPSLRGTITTTREGLYKGKGEKSLLRPLSGKGGRNSAGRRTVRHQGGRHKRRYRLVDFARKKTDIRAVVERLEYDPNRSARIALIKYDDGKLSYILAPNELKAGDEVWSGNNVEIKVGNAMPLSRVPLGVVVHNVELKVGGGGKLIRSAGAGAQLVSKEGNFAQLQLVSGENRLVPLGCWATIGVVSNADHKNIKLGKAGRNRWKGVRPSVRGVAMNPVDHPHGGGEGRSGTGGTPVSPWGKPTKGMKTRNRKKSSSKLILSRKGRKRRR